MFSPIGKKKILLGKKYSKGVDSPKETDSNPSPKKEKIVLAGTAAAVVASTRSLERALADVGVNGVIMNRIMEATTRYHPERDADVLKAFDSKCLEYERFRSFLYSIFWISFTDAEFAAVVEYFDPGKAGVINGYDFMVAFIRLNGIRKDRMSLITREKNEEAELRAKEDEERRQYILENKQVMNVNFDFSDESRKSAMEKLMSAAIKFDPAHPSSPSLDAFNVKSVMLQQFREMLKLTFNLKLDASELGAVLKAFDPSASAKDIVACDFLKYFLRLGFEGRQEEKTKQLKKQKQLDEQAEAERKAKAEEAKNKATLLVDYNFTEVDEFKILEKLRLASTKYDKSAPGSVSLTAFECETLSPQDFKDIVRQIFNVSVTPTELGYIVKKYDVKLTGTVHCKTFLVDFMRWGQEARHEAHSTQLKKQRTALEKAEEDHAKKIHEVANSESIKIDYEFTDDHLQSALAKLTEASKKYDKVRGVSLISFEPAALTPLEFKKALKRTFNIRLTAKEMGAAIQHFDENGTRMINCQKFLTSFVALGFHEKSKIRREQLNAQREAEQRMEEEHQRKILDLSSKVLYDVDFNCSVEDQESALRKMTIAATKYDPKHPAALGLDGFERKTMSPAEFKEIVRRTFNLRLTGAEVGALFKFFHQLHKSYLGEAQGVEDGKEVEDDTPADQIICGEFLKYFLRRGVDEREKVHKEQLERQREEDRQREEEHKQKVEELKSRGSYQPDMKWDESDKESILAKMLKASEGFDKYHPAAPSLEPFDALKMPPGLFRENIKRIFGIVATPKEIGYLLSEYDKDQSGEVNSKEFLLKFLAMGKEERGRKRREFLEQTRLANIQRVKEEEEKIAAMFEKAELAVDYDFKEEDFKSAVEKMTEASFKYDKNHPAAPSLAGFSGGPIKPGAFRELMKRTFNVLFTNKELGAVASRYVIEGCDRDNIMVDGKAFLIAFMKLGFDKRAKFKTQTLEKQRKAEIEKRQEEELKAHIASQRVVLEIDNEYTEVDRISALSKLTKAAAMYDKNAPGAVGTEAFDAAFLTPGMFREVLKRTFNVVFEPREMAAMIQEYNNGSGNVNSQQFLVAFIKMGALGRDKIKILQLEKQRRQNQLRKTEHERKMKEAEDRILLNINYTFTEIDREVVFEKLRVAAKKYDKSHPAAMSLDGFEEKELKPHVFREMLKRTFNVTLEHGELGALMQHFDKNRGTVNSKKFLIYFLRLGIAEREKEHDACLAKLRTDEQLRVREQEEKLAAQWSKMEISLKGTYSEAEKRSAMEKLAEAAFKFDPASPGPMGLTAFEAAHLSPALFREMLRRSFGMRVSDGELAALVAEFDTNGDKKVKCREFMVRFTALGFERRSAARASQLTRQRTMHQEAKLEFEMKKAAADEKVEIFPDFSYTEEDAQSALEKIRVIAANYDRAHVSAPSLTGFMGCDMKLVEFKEMMMRTFHVPLDVKELTALMKFFAVSLDEKGGSAKVKGGAGGASDSEEDIGRSALGSRQMSRSSTMRRSIAPHRINTQAFLAYFNRIQREEATKRSRNRITRERELKRAEKEHQQSLVQQSVDAVKKALMYTDADEQAMVANIVKAAEEFAIDSSTFIEPMQRFKGPALPPDKFREIFHQVFMIWLTFPQMGAMLKILDPTNIGSFDGGQFLNWFKKLSRIQEKFMLEESTSCVTLDLMREVSTVKSTLDSPSRSGSPTLTTAKSKTAKFFPPTPDSSKTSAPGKFAAGAGAAAGTSVKFLDTGSKGMTSSTASAMGFPSTPGAQSVKTAATKKTTATSASAKSSSQMHAPARANSLASFAEATLNQSWFLPTIVTNSFVLEGAGGAAGAGGAYNSMEDFDIVDREETKEHLQRLFDADLHTDAKDIFTSTILSNASWISQEEESFLNFSQEVPPGKLYSGLSPTHRATSPVIGRESSLSSVKTKASTLTSGLKQQSKLVDSHPGHAKTADFSLQLLMTPSIPLNDILGGTAVAASAVSASPSRGNSRKRKEKGKTAYDKAPKGRPSKTAQEEKERSKEQELKFLQQLFEQPEASVDSSLELPSKSKLPVTSGAPVTAPNATQPSPPKDALLSAKFRKIKEQVGGLHTVKEMMAAKKPKKSSSKNGGMLLLDPISLKQSIAASNKVNPKAAGEEELLDEEEGVEPEPEPFNLSNLFFPGGLLPVVKKGEVIASLLEEERQQAGNSKEGTE